MEYGVIMAGGLGTRLWPLSRQSVPKQLLQLSHGKSLLQLAFDRLHAALPADRIFVCTAEQHRAAVLGNLPQLPPENVLGEPMPRDTANAVGFPAAVLYKRDPQAVFAVVTADHVIEPVETFADRLRVGFAIVKEQPRMLVTFGIVPTHGHTGLGYIQRGEPIKGQPSCYQVQAFKEKPDKPTADRYVESGRCYWNSGMFVWRADTVLDQLGHHLPDAHRGLMNIANAWGSPQQQGVLQEEYARLPKISIDFAVMEPASHQHAVAVVELPVNWTDIGSYPALAETMQVDDHDNAIDAGSITKIDSDGNIVVSRDPNHLISIIGVSDMIIIHTPDATLICPKSENQRVKDMVAKVKEKYGEKYL